MCWPKLPRRMQHGAVALDLKPSIGLENKPALPSGGLGFGRSRSVMTIGRRLVVSILIAIHASLVAWIGWQTSPSLVETGHLIAGLYSWRTHHFDVFSVNPPLIRGIATAPVAVCRPQYNWSRYSPVRTDRCEWPLGMDFIRANHRDIRWYFAIARGACVCFSVLGAYFCYRFAKEIYGVASGICALLIWCFSPMLLAWGATICPDAPAASMGVVAFFFSGNGCATLLGNVLLFRALCSAFSY